MRRPLTIALACFTSILLFSGAALAQSDHDRLLVEIYRELIEIDTSPSGSTTVAAEAMAARLRSEGFPDEDVQVLGPRPARGNLVARMRGTGQAPPILLLGHLDVVEARPEDWSYDPFTLNEIDGYFYGRVAGLSQG